MAKGNPEIYKLARPFTSSDSWDEPLADKPTQVKLPQSMKDYVDSQPDRGAWLRRVIAAAIEAETQAEMTPTSENAPAPSSPHRYSRAELSGVPVQDLRKLVSLEGGATKRDGKVLTKAQAIDFLLKIAAGK